MLQKNMRTWWNNWKFLFVPLLMLALCFTGIGAVIPLLWIMRKSDI